MQKGRLRGAFAACQKPLDAGGYMHCCLTVLLLQHLQLCRMFRLVCLVILACCTHMLHLLGSVATGVLSVLADPKAAQRFSSSFSDSLPPCLSLCPASTVPCF